MAEQYLNKEGVQTLWSAVKGKISTAQQTVENEFTNGSKVAHTANNANNLGGVAPGGYVKQVKVGNITYTANNSLISLPSYATLDNSGKVPTSQLPSYVDDVIEGYYSSGKFYYNEDRTNEISSETGKIYTDLISNKTYRWGGSTYVEISASLAIGTTVGTAYDGASGAKNASDISNLQNSVSANAGNITDLRVNKADKNHTHTFSTITNKPTTLSGYGITDAYTKAETDSKYATASHTHTFSAITNKPTTLSGYGITDAYGKGSVYTKSETDSKYVHTSATTTYTSTGPIAGQATGTSKIVNAGYDGITLSYISGTASDGIEMSSIVINSSGISFKINQTPVTFAKSSDIPTAISTSELNSILV